MNYSIPDARNHFGALQAAGTFPNSIYVGKGDPAKYITDPKYPAQGGEVKIPYFAGVVFSKDISTEIAITVLGAPENNNPASPPGAGEFKEIGKLVIKPEAGKQYNCAASGTDHKWFRVKLDGALTGYTGADAVNAFLYRG
jgi:hypothetical protein